MKIKDRFLQSLGCNVAIEVIKLYDDILIETFKKAFEKDEIPLTIHNIEAVLNTTKEKVINKLQQGA